VTRYVLDACAIHYYLAGDSQGHRAKKLFHSAVSGEACLFISAVNWSEVIYPAYQKGGPVQAQSLQTYMDTFPLIVQPADLSIGLRAARFKGIHGLTLADAFAAATAHHLNATLVTSDKSFRSVESQIEILWL
jgi:predicted nucleic acid-binding protein